MNETDFQEEEAEEDERRRKRNKKKKELKKKRILELGKKTQENDKTKISDISVIILEKPEVNFKKTEVNKQISKIEEYKSEIKVPILLLEQPEVNFKKTELNKQISKIEEFRSEIKVPIFLVEQPQIESKRTQVQRKIPIIKSTNEITQKPELKPKNVPKEEQKKKKMDKSLKQEQEISPEEEEILEMEGERVIIIEKEEKIFGFNAKDLSGKPIVIFLDDPNSSFTGVLEYLCWRLYREIIGGGPEPRKINDLDEFQKEIFHWLEAENKIYTIEFNNKIDKKDLKWHIIRSKLEQLFGQQLGFIIFKNLNLLTDDYMPRDHIINFITLTPNEYLEKEFDLAKKLCCMIWGFVEIMKKDLENYFFSNTASFNYLFNLAKVLYERKLGELNSKEPYISSTKRQKFGNESDEVHFPIKVFVVEYLSNKMGFKKIEDIIKIKKFIKTEEKHSDFNKKYQPDIYINGESEEFPNEVFEIETLFGEGINAMKKVDETIEKYEDSSIKKLNIVLENITLLFHLEEIKEKSKIHGIYKEGNVRNFDLEFWTLDLKNSRLINLEDFMNNLLEFKKKNFFPIFFKKTSLQT